MSRKREWSYFLSSFLPQGLTITLPQFIGGLHFSEGGYEHIATQLFEQIDVDYYLLEYDTPRAGGFEPLAQLPARKQVGE
jgi:hypothetical protein